MKNVHDWIRALVGNTMQRLMVFLRNWSGEGWIHWVYAIFVLTLPLSIYWPIGQPAAEGILPMYVTPGIYLSDFTALAIILTGAILWVKRPKRLSGMSSLTIPLLILIALSIVTIPWAISQKLALYSAFRWLLSFALYLALIQMDVPSEKVRFIFLGGLGVHAVIGLAQVLHQGSIGLPGELIPGWDQSRVAAIQLGDQWWLRAYGLTFHPNVFGGFMMVGLMMGLPMLHKPAVIPLWMLFFMGLLLSFSRSAWMATMLILPLVAGWMVWRHASLRRPLLIAVGILFLTAIVFSLLQFEQIRVRLSVFTSSSERGSWLGRGELIATAFRAIESRPLTGLGAGNFPLAVLLTDIQEIPHAVHNIPLLLAAEIGIVGGLVWLWLWLWPGYSLAAIEKDADPWLISLVGSWLALGIVGLWDFYPWGLNAGRLLTVTLIAWTSRAMAKRYSVHRAIHVVAASRIPCKGDSQQNFIQENIHPQA
jgi:hypothetical protein